MKHWLGVALIIPEMDSLAIPASAQDHDYYVLTQRIQPLQPWLPKYQMTVPTVPEYRIHVPPVPEYNPPPQRDWRDLVNDAMRGYRGVPPGHTPESYQMMLDRQDRARQRNDYAECAKYNRWCVNMLRSLGER